MKAADGKWFPDVMGSLPVMAAAQTVLKVRTAALRRRLRALDGFEADDTERIHELRVTARRLAAALSAFEPLNPKAIRRASRACAKVRRAAGDVRDADVLLVTLRPRLERCARIPRKLVDAIFATFEDARHQATNEFECKIEKVGRKFEREISRLLEELATRAATEHDFSSDYGSLARRVIVDQASRMLALAGEDLSDVESLHQLRIACKRLRYGLELFMGCFSRESVDELYEALSEIQERLGTINDLRNLYARLAELRSELLDVQCDVGTRQRTAHLDTLSATTGHEWIERQRFFVRDWVSARRGLLKKSLTFLLNGQETVRRFQVGTRTVGEFDMNRIDFNAE